MASPDDNVAIATQRLEAGSSVHYQDKILTVDATVLEGHRFAVTTISQGKHLLSWSLPFGVATKDIYPGQYVANQSIINALTARRVNVSLPKAGNFDDLMLPYHLDETSFEAAEQLSPYRDSPPFSGFIRSENRGVGTRNCIIILATSSLSSSFAQTLAKRFEDHVSAYKNIDGIVPIAHTEGGLKTPANNHELVLRTLAGFMIHPNVGAVLVVDVPGDALNNQALQSYLAKHRYPSEEVKHQFFSLGHDLLADLREGEQIVQAWLEPVNAYTREQVSAANLNLALQCGGSDAFSGVSGNPLVASVAKDIIRFGGKANLAETDELIGAEPYILQKVKSLKVAKQFLATIQRFKARAAWHGTSAEGNPSGGNKLRGLYNIALKSIGAANKKHPELRLDAVIEYGEPMRDPGFYFMDSPGNDLESIAGQVAAGCNIIFFVTGNGSITNFPFVPTIKVVTTSHRFDHLKDDMDVNAGAYLQGTPMEELSEDTLKLLLNIASGQPSIGEQAGHAQVQLWRNWQQSNGGKLKQLSQQKPPSGEAIRIQSLQVEPQEYLAFDQRNRLSSDSIALIVPTSLCSGQIGLRLAERLNQTQRGQAKGIRQFVSLVHTEGCGVSGDGMLASRPLVNYLRHPAVKHALLLEHGCEMTHNDHMHTLLEKLGMNSDVFGWASIQLDGGIEKVEAKVESWFQTQIEASTKLQKVTAKLAHVRLGLHSTGTLSANAQSLFATLARQIVGAGGTVVVPETASLFDSSEFRSQLSIQALDASLAYGQYAMNKGFHIMQTPTQHWIETLTGLGATGVELVMVHTQHPLQTHPFIPVLQVCSDEAVGETFRDAIDLTLSQELGADRLLGHIMNVLSHHYLPKRYGKEKGFQITRGLLNISM